MHILGGGVLEVIDKINAILKQRGMTGAELSRAIGLSTAVYSQWNRRKTKPSNKNIVKVAEVLGVPVSELTSKEQNEKPPAQGGEPDEETIELREIWDSSDADERRALLEMARLIKKRRNK